MHHIYTGGKGDPLCPLGFHPQVRWPTRCKRCFRDYKEHGGKVKDPGPSKSTEDMTRSTPSLNSWTSLSVRSGEDKKVNSPIHSSVSAASNDSAFINGNNAPGLNSSFSTNKSLSSSWTSTPDLGKPFDDVSTTVSVTLPRRRVSSQNTSSSNQQTEFTVRKRAYTTDLSQTGLLNGSHNNEKHKNESSDDKSRKKTPSHVIEVQSGSSSGKHTKKSISDAKKSGVKALTKSKKPEECENTNGSHINPDVEFILRVKSSKPETAKKTPNLIRQTSSVMIPTKTSSSSSSSEPEDSVAEEEDEDDAASMANTETTETTLVGKNDSELQEEIDFLKNELEIMKARCERVEREKSDILLRRLASFDTTSTKTAASEVLKLQQKVNELSSQSEDLKDDNKSLSLRVKELEKELEDQKVSTSSSRKTEELQAKLAAAETLCEELMDENEEMKKELRELEEEIEEMQDNFREDQADEYSSLKKELEQTTKNCRILSFKLRKSERKAEQLESQKLEAELKYKEVLDQKGTNNIEKIKTLESELKVANELSTRLKKDLEEANKRLNAVESKNGTLKNNQKTGNTLKPGGEKVSRASLTRGGSQEDPQQLLRDLQDSMEREADLREQLRFAEEEAANLRKKAARIEEDNDSLSLQLKKMASKARNLRRSSPSTNQRMPLPAVGKNEETSDEEDPAELRLLLELNEQESTVLRKKIEDLENEAEKNKKKIKDLEEKLLTMTSRDIGISNNKILADNGKTKATPEEIAELKKVIAGKNEEIKKLEKEIELAQKKSPKVPPLLKSQSLDSPMEYKSLDLRKQLDMIEQEAAILRTKITTLEAENEKLNSENKKLQLMKGIKKAGGSGEGVITAAKDKSALESKILSYEKEIKELKEKLKSQESKPKENSSTFGKESVNIDQLKSEVKTKSEELEKIQAENKKFQEKLKRLREDAAIDVTEFYKSRKPKKPTDLTTKLQLKKMVEELENEIGDILVVLKRVRSQKSKEEKDFDLEGKSKVIVELEEKAKVEKEKWNEESRKTAETISRLEKEKENWTSEKRKLEAEITKLIADKRNSTATQDEVKIMAKKLELSIKQLEDERSKIKKLNERVETLEKLEEKQGQLENEVASKTAKVLDSELKLAEFEEKLKKAEKNLTSNRGKVTKLEKAIEELEKTKKDKEKKFQALEDELSKTNALNSSLKGKLTDLEEETKKSKDAVKTLEESFRKEREKMIDEHLKSDSIEKKEITMLRDELTTKSKQLDEINKKLENAEKARKTSEENYKKSEAEIAKQKISLENKASTLETELQAERKKNEQIKIVHEKEQRNRDVEIGELKSKVTNLEKKSKLSIKEMTEKKEEWSKKLTKLEKALTEENKKYSDLTSKYELLEEEHFVTKAQLVLEKDQAETQLEMNKKEVAALEGELKKLQELFFAKQETWAKEKKELQEKLKGNLEKVTKASETKWELEKSKLQAINDEQKSRMENIKQQNESMAVQMDHMRKENEELRKKLDDFDKVSKIQRQISADNQSMEKQLKEAKEKLVAEEKNHKNELAALKLRYESRVNLISGELLASQNHVSKFKKERDTFKHMLEEARTQMAELKKGSNPSDMSDELKDSKTTMASLEQQISCLEDELSEARLECSKLRTELVSEKSTREVKFSELQSKVNELEEEKILSSGRTKVAGLRTKMELAWQKEREDQQRLLHETSALARDLRQTLYEVERERDKIKLESKRIQEQLKKASEEEMEENRKKITELQCDLLELRDAHAKLRTTNEKLRREKEKWDKESRTVQKSRMRSEEDNKKFYHLLDNIDLLLKANFEKKSTKKFSDGPFKKSGSKSRETSPMAAPTDEIQLIMQRLSETAEDVRRRMEITERLDDRTKRASSLGYRRAASTESDTSEASVFPRRPVPVSRKTTLHRKSVSLSETANVDSQDQAIWRGVDGGGSLTSLDEQMGHRLKNSEFRENSMDSRLSGSSTQSEMIPGDKKKKKGIFGKLKKLAKSRSIEDPVSSQEDVMAKACGSDSDMSTGGDFRDSKKDLKGKLADMFKKDSSGLNKLKQAKPSENNRGKTIPIQSSGMPAANFPGGRPLDKAKNPAATHLTRP